MAHPVSGINPTVLSWARTRSGQTLKQVAEALGKEPELIERWELGEAAPTYVQLETLAYKVYKRPIALFFFPEPPDERDPAQEFRTLPDFELQDLAPDTRFKVRQALALQLSLSELSNGKNPASRLITQDVSVDPYKPAEQAAHIVRDYLGVALDEQIGWKATEEALKAWRTAVEQAGVFVFKDTFKQREVSGFSLFDGEFPLVYVNNSTSRTRQVFTIFHELAHLLVHMGGVTLRHDAYIRGLPADAKQVETFCNAFAAHVLVPEPDFRNQDHSVDDSNILRLARRYKVSREVILRRLRDLGLVSQQLYARKAEQWAQDYFEHAAEEAGGNYYLTHASYLSDAYMRMAFRHYYHGGITLEQLAGYLNVKASSVAGLEQVVLERIR